MEIEIYKRRVEIRSVVDEKRSAVEHKVGVICESVWWS